MGMHASLIWPSVIVLVLLGPGWNAWQSYSCPISPSRLAIIGAAIPALAESRSESLGQTLCRAGWPRHDRDHRRPQANRASTTLVHPQGKDGQALFHSTQGGVRKWYACQSLWHV